MHRSELTRVLLAGTLAIGACRATPPAPQPQSAPAAQATSAAPAAPGAGFGNVWDFLLDKYDADGNGRVDAGEYGRGTTAFARLDSNGDGSVDASDFEAQRDPINLMVAQMVMASYMQDDEDSKRLEPEELEAAFGAYDENFDALLTRAEFEAACEGRARHGLIPSDDLRMAAQHAQLYDVMTSAMDGNRDGTLEYEEVMAFHARFFATGDLAAREVALRGVDAPDAPLTIAAPGEMAPDFTLEPLDGGPAVQLASFRDERPVALIFGSYT